MRGVRSLIALALFYTTLTGSLQAQTFFWGDTLGWEVGMNVKSSYLQLAEANQQLTSANYLPLDDYTQEINLYFNMQVNIAALGRVGFSVSTSNGGSSNVTPDKTRYSNLKVHYLSAAVFKELNFKRLTVRGFVAYEKADYRGEFFVRTPGGTSLSNLNGGIIVNYSTGVKPSAQLLIGLGKKRRNSLGVEWSYFYRLDQEGWRYYPAGPPTNLPDLKNGEQAFSFVYLYRFYNH